MPDGNNFQQVNKRKRKTKNENELYQNIISQGTEVG